MGERDSTQRKLLTLINVVLDKDPPIGGVFGLERKVGVKDN